MTFKERALSALQEKIGLINTILDDGHFSEHHIASLKGERTGIQESIAAIQSLHEDFE